MGRNKHDANTREAIQDQNSRQVHQAHGVFGNRNLDPQVVEKIGALRYANNR